MSRVWIVLDALIVLVFIVIGRSTHHHGLRLSGIVSTTWPFAVGLALGWLCVVLRRQDGASLKGGIVIWLFTVIAGMTLRVLFGQGTALAFIFVALGFLGALMLGLRALARRYRRWRRGRIYA
jgi:hypothetical protein